MQKKSYTMRIVILCSVVALVLVLGLGGLIFYQFNQSINISQSDAEHIVLNEYGGYIRKSEVDYDDFHVTYEVTIVTNHNQELEITVDGKTGEIIEVDD